MTHTKLYLAVEKHSNNYSLASKMVKEQMDKKFGAAWHCIIGEGFNAEVSRTFSLDLQKLIVF